MLFGAIAIVCYGGFLIPQVIHDQCRKSTTGLSMWMIGLWFAGFVVLAAFSVCQVLAAYVIAANVLCCTSCCVIITQHYAFAHDPSPPHTLCRSSLLLLALNAMAASIGVAWYYLFSAIDYDARVVVGSVFPSVMFAGGFIPQFVVIFQTQSCEGYSTWLMLVDLLGSSSACLALFFDDDFRAQTAAPYLTFFVLQLSILLLKFTWFRIRSQATDSPTGDSMQFM